MGPIIRDFQLYRALAGFMGLQRQNTAFTTDRGAVRFHPCAPVVTLVTAATGGFWRPTHDALWIPQRSRVTAPDARGSRLAG